MIETIYVPVAQDKWRRVNKWTPVEAERIIIPGWSQFDFFIHREVTASDMVRPSKRWQITEGTSGAAMGSAKDKKDEVLEYVKNILDTHYTVRKLKEQIKASVEYAEKSTGEKNPKKFHGKVAENRAIHAYYSNNHKKTKKTKKSKQIEDSVRLK